MALAIIKNDYHARDRESNNLRHILANHRPQLHADVVVIVAVITIQLPPQFRCHKHNYIHT